jgi:hypothetical protein
MTTALLLALLTRLIAQPPDSRESHGARPTRPALKIQCYELIHPAILGPAESAVTRIMDAAQLPLEMTWINCRRPGEAAPGGAASAAGPSTTFTVTILPEAMAKALASFEDQMGMTPRSDTRAGRLAYVFYDRVEQFARYYRTDRGSVLGAAIGHELGHMLLPTPSHSATGLMRPAWLLKEFQQIDRGWLLFTPEQAQLIRARLTADALLLSGSGDKKQ